MSEYQQNSATIYSLQSYITQLTVYINQNNAKYTKNLQTLKSFYESQIKDISIKNNNLEQQNLQYKNQLITLRDLLNNRQKQIKDLKFKIHQINQENQSNRHKLNQQRNKIDQLYQEIQIVKKNFGKEIDNQQKFIKEIDNQKNDLILKLKEKQQEINKNKNQIDKLQNQLSQRYSLPEKLKDIQIESMKNKTLVATLTQNKKQLQTKIDFLNNQLEQIKKQNKKLSIANQTITANTKLQINQSLTKQKQKANQKQKKLESINEKQLFEINQLQNTLKMLKKQNNQFEKRLNQFVQENKMLKQKVQNHDLQKQKYIDQWRKLKTQYEEVIKNLQDAIPLYQKKIFDLQHQNTDLNVQLDGLRDLLNEIKAMNSLQPLKQQYRQIAQLELLAQKDYKVYKEQQKHNSVSQTSYKDKEFTDKKDSTQFNWDKLLADIQNIQVA